MKSLLRIFWVRFKLYTEIIMVKLVLNFATLDTAKCFYHSGKSYGDEDAYTELISNVSKFETESPNAACNRLFYLAIPPNVFGESGLAIKNVGMAVKGWTRLIIEKPFGRDLDTCNELLSTLSAQFEEEHLYRIDHYLGKVRAYLILLLMIIQTILHSF